MKYIFTLLIVVVSLFFSSVFSASAQEGYLERLLQLSTGLESYHMDEIPKLPARTFSNAAVQKTYDEFLKLDTLLRGEFIEQYQNGDISYYQMQDLVANYSDFLYYTGKTFSYVSEHEKGMRGDDINSAIESGYSNMRMSYAQVKIILERK